MPIKKSAKKRLRQNITRRARNLAQTKVLKKAIKDCQKNLASKSPSGKLVSKTIALIDKAAKNSLIHKNKANRIKSKLQKISSSKQVKLETGKLVQQSHSKPKRSEGGIKKKTEISKKAKKKVVKKEKEAGKTKKQK